MMPSSVRITKRADVDVGRPPTTVARLISVLQEVNLSLRGEVGHDLEAFVALAKAMPVDSLQALIDAQAPTVKWVEVKLVAFKRSVARRYTDPTLSNAIDHAVSVLRGEKWLAA